MAQGKTSALIANEIRHTGKILHLFDLVRDCRRRPKKTCSIDDIFALGKMEAYAGTMREPMAKVLNQLSEISFPQSRYIIHPGYFDAVLKTDRT